MPGDPTRSCGSRGEVGGEPDVELTQAGGEQRAVRQRGEAGAGGPCQGAGPVAIAGGEPEGAGEGEAQLGEVERVAGEDAAQAEGALERRERGGGLVAGQGE